jgi:alpha-beta hydrolase superfamily lysophospholipase
MGLMFRTHDGLTLQGRAWPCRHARGTIVIVHGLGEHIGRYAHVAASLNAGGWSVVGYDQRGHGASEGQRGRLGAANDLLRDLAVVLDGVRAGADFAAPLVLLGHSMGGTVASRFVAGGLETPKPAWWLGVDALVLSSPALDLGMGPLQKAMLATLEPLAPNLGVGNGLKPAWISRDPAVVAAYVADPQVHDRIAPRLVRFMPDAGIAVLALAPRWNVPTLLLYAGSDRCVVPAGSAAFAAAAPKDVVTTRVFAPLFHEIFNEPERAEVLSVLASWLDTLPLSPSRSPR